MRRTVIGAAVLLVGMLLGYAVWQAAGEDREVRPAPPSADAFDAAQRQAFDVLRGATRPVPAALQARMRRARNKSIRTLWLDTARYVPVDRGLWVVNGKGRTCIIQAHGGAVSCAPRAALFRSGVALGVVDLGPPPHLRAKRFIVAGIVPNWIKAVDMQVGDELRTVAVRNNSYSLRAAEPIVVKRFARSG